MCLWFERAGGSWAAAKIKKKKGRLLERWILGEGASLPPGACLLVFSPTRPTTVRNRYSTTKTTKRCCNISIGQRSRAVCDQQIPHSVNWISGSVHWRGSVAGGLVSGSYGGTPVGCLWRITLNMSFLLLSSECDLLFHKYVFFKVFFFFFTPITTVAGSEERKMINR